ncbi:MAG: hypothetical protein ACXAEX_24230 [Promethearchaeota archaeon]
MNRSIISPPRLGINWNPVAMSACVRARYIVFRLISCGIIVFSSVIYCAFPDPTPKERLDIF